MNLRVAKRSRFFALQRDDTDNGSLPHHRYGKPGAHGDKVSQPGAIVLGIGEDIGHINCTALQNRAAEKRAAIRIGGIAGETVTLPLAETVGCGDGINVTFTRPENAAIRLAQAHR